MAKTGIRAIIFDIGRVLVRVDVRQSQSVLANGSSLTPEELWFAIEKDPRWKDWQEGRISPRDWHLNLTKRFGIALSFDDFVRAWNSALDPQPIHPDSFFKDLSRNYRMGLLSNTDPIHVSHLENTFAFYAYFPRPVRIYSCAVGATKPDPLIFREALKACKVNAEQAVYIDDIAKFAEAARALGMNGIQYLSRPQLLTDFQQLGVKVQADVSA
jgi:glucose-1-phosphatase